MGLLFGPIYSSSEDQSYEYYEAAQEEEVYVWKKNQKRIDFLKALNGIQYNLYFNINY